MSKLVSKLNDEVVNYILNLHMEQTLSDIISSYKKQIKKEQSITIVEEKIKLLNTIAIEEKLDIEYLKNKYLTSKELALSDSLYSELSCNNNSNNELILTKIEIDNKHYYYEQHENGKIFNKESKIVGVYKNKEFIFTL
jgi:hypothetical protein